MNKGDGKVADSIVQAFAQARKIADDTESERLHILDDSWRRAARRIGVEIGVLYDQAIAEEKRDAELKALERPMPEPIVETPPVIEERPALPRGEPSLELIAVVMAAISANFPFDQRAPLAKIKLAVAARAAIDACEKFASGEG